MEKAIELLKKSGWVEGRKVDISNVVQNYFDTSYELSKTQEFFLKEYLDLDIKYPSQRVANLEMIISINPTKAGFAINDIMEIYERFIGESLFAVGDFELFPMTILLAKSGAFYGVNGEFVFEFGTDFKQVIDCCIDRRLSQIMRIEDF